MAKEQDAVMEFLNGAKQPDELFQEAPKDEEIVEEKEEDEKPLPFHKDPKVQKYIEKQIAKSLEGVKPTAEKDFKEAVSSDVEEVIGAFSTIIGNDTPEKVRALEALKKTLNGADERASAKAIERFQQQAKEQETAQKQADDQALEELNNGFEQIEEDFGIDLESDTKTRSAFVAFLTKVSPKNADGEVREFADIPSAWETFQEINKKTPAPSRAKELASRGLTRSGDTKSATPAGRSWKDVDRYFDSLKKNA